MKGRTGFVQMSSRLVVGYGLTQHNALCRQVPKFRDSGKELFPWRTDRRLSLHLCEILDII